MQNSILDEREGTNFATETVHALMGQEEEYIQMLKIQKNLAINGSFTVHGKLVQYSKKSLFFFDEQNQFRKMAVWIIEWKWFDRLIMLAIAINSILLSLYDYSDRDGITIYNSVINWIGNAFTILFLIEATLKIFGMGFLLHKHAYLRDGWNFLDFVIVVTGVLDLVANSVNLKSLRTLRVLRPLRSINAIPSMRRLVITLLQSLPELANATIFLTFIIVLFGILGLQQFNGITYYKCRLTEQPINATFWPKSHEYNRVCSPGGDGDFVCPNGLTCGNPLQYGISLEDDGVYSDKRILYGISTFDNFGLAILTVFQIITRDQWTQIMYNMADGYTAIFSKLYCCSIVVIGSYCMLNLILAVIMSNFIKIQQQEAEIDIMKREEEMLKAEGKLRDLEESKISSEGDITNRFQLLTQRQHMRRNGAGQEIQIIKEEDEDENKMEFEESKNPSGSSRREQEELTPFQLLLKKKKEKEAKKRYFEEQNLHLQQEAALERKETVETNRNAKLLGIPNNTGKQMGQGLGLALFAKAFGINNQVNNKGNDQFSLFKEEMGKALQIQDIRTRLSMQQKIYEEQGKLLKKMDLEIRKKYVMGKRNNYGIENEQQIISQIKKSLKEQLRLRKNGQFTNGLNNLNNTTQDSIDYIEPELDEITQMSLKIISNLKELTMKAQIKQLIMERFKKQLIKKSVLEKIFTKVQNQMTDNILVERASRNIYYKICFTIAKSCFFQFLAIFCIVGNAVVLAMDFYPVNNDYESYLEIFNLGFFSFFVMELIIKLSAYGFKYYFKDKFNWFDSAVVFVNNQSGSGAISALRVFRLIKVFQLAKVWKAFQDLLNVISSTIKDISNVSVLLLIFIFTYTLLGMDMFAYRAKFNDHDELDFSRNGKYPQSTFNTFYEAVLSVFIVLANDGWTEIYFNQYRSTTGWSASLYFISLLIIGQYILLNLFIAILIENFEQVSVQQDTVNRHNKEKRDKKLRRMLLAIFCFKKVQIEPSPRTEAIMDEEEQQRKKQKDERDLLRPSLFLFKVDNKFRVFLKKTVEHVRFEYVMLLTILLSSIQQAIDNPLNDPTTNISFVLTVIDISCTCIFAIEAGMKIISYGFALCGSQSYIRNMWNILDFAIVMLSVISLSLLSNQASIVKIFRLLKVLRPLRVISRNEGLRISLRSLAIAIPGILNVLLVQLIFYLIFGIIGINYFKGKMYYCQTNQILRSQQLIETMDDKWDCLNAGGEWLNYYARFDNIGEAIKTLFITSTTVQWATFMYRTVAARGIDLVPIQMSNPSASIYYVVFIVIGNFFMLNLFVGVLISTYNREKEVLGKNFLLTDKQRKWLQNKIMLIQSKPMLRMKLPQSEWRQPFFYLAEFKWFDRFILLCILVNTVVLAISWYGQPEQVDNITGQINYVFAGIFTLEVIIKFTAYGFRYFKDGWNIFDIFIVLLTLISIILSVTTKVQLGPQTTIIRSFRIARVFKLFKRNKSLKAIFQTFMVTLPAMANVGSLLALFIFIYAILGVYLFAEIMYNGQLDSSANFNSIGTAFLTLMRISTGEDWPLLMDALSKDYSIDYKCIHKPTYDDYVNNGKSPVGCGDYYFSLIFFFSYVLLIDLIYLKLFIAIILQGFQDINEKDNRFLNSETSDNFRETWSRFDQDATTFMRVSNYPRFLVALGEPLGWDQSYEYNYLKQLEYLAEVSLPKYNNQKDYQFMDVFENLALLMIVKKEVKDYMRRYMEKVTNIERIKKMFVDGNQQQQLSIQQNPSNRPNNSQNSNSQRKQLSRSNTQKNKLLKSPAKSPSRKGQRQNSLQRKQTQNDSKSYRKSNSMQKSSRGNNKSAKNIKKEAEPEDQSQLKSSFTNNNLQIILKDASTANRSPVKTNLKIPGLSEQPLQQQNLRSIKKQDSFKLDEDIEAQIDALLGQTGSPRDERKPKDTNFEDWAYNARQPHNY